MNSAIVDDVQLIPSVDFHRLLVAVLLNANQALFNQKIWVTAKPGETSVQVHVTPSFETAAPELQLLVRSIFVGDGERYPNEVVMRFWRVE